MIIIGLQTLSNFSCVILGGLVAEHIAFGHSEGHYADIDKVRVFFSFFLFFQGCFAMTDFSLLYLTATFGNFGLWNSWNICSDG